MATAATQAGSSLFDGTILQLLQSAIGGTKDQNIVKSETGTTTGTQNTTGMTTGNTSQNTSGTNKQTGTTSTTGNVAGTTANNQQRTADIAQLLQVFQQQQAGISPEALAALFTEGSKAAPGLVTANANAVGARSSNNTPLATALTGLSSDLTSKAAQISMQQRDASAVTAGKIAELTGGVTTTGTSNQQSDQQVATQQLTELLQQVLGTSAQNTTQNQANNTATTNNSNINNQEDTQLNTGNIAKLIGGLLGAGGLNSVLQGAGVGGIGGAASGIGGLLTQGGAGIGELLKQLIGGGTPALPTTGDLARSERALETAGLNSGGFSFPTDATGQIDWDALLRGSTSGGFMSPGAAPQDINAGFGLGLGDGTSALTDSIVSPDWWSAEGWDTYWDF